MDKTKETFTILNERFQVVWNIKVKDTLRMDCVFLRLQPYKKSTLKQKKNWKSTPNFMESAKFIWNIGKVVYELYFPFSHMYVAYRGFWDKLCECKQNFHN